MLTDLALVNCYNKTGMSQKERDRIMLSSAKRNLAGIFLKMNYHQLCMMYDFRSFFIYPYSHVIFRINGISKDIAIHF